MEEVEDPTESHYSLLSLSTFSIINVSPFAKFPETISRDFNMVVF